MILATVETIPGKEVTILGFVRGSYIQSKHIGKDIGASLKTIVGGELRGYTGMIEEATESAIQRMIDQAAQLGADGIVGVRLTTTSVVQGAAEVTAYGTAVRIE